MTSKVRRYCLALDLVDAPDVIAAYREHHCKGGVWPAVINSIRDADVLDMEIYLTGNRLFMIMEVGEQFSFAAKAQSDAMDPVVQAWEALMMKYQKPLPCAQPGKKWTPMERIFSLKEHETEP